MGDADGILDVLVDVAARDERVRTVLLEGSRADPRRTPDIFQDYDVVYLVTDVTPFVRNRAWAEQFGDILLLQQPEDMEEPPPARDGSWAYLMLLRNGSRIDLTLRPVIPLATPRPGAASVVLLDKDGALARQTPGGDGPTAPPTGKAFADCCNECHWVSTNVAKGLWRGEIVYAKVMLEQFVRPQVMRMLDWYIALESRVDPGMFGRRYPELLPARVWESWARSYTDADLDRSWTALFALHDVFRTAASAVGQRLGYEYPASEGLEIRAYLDRVRHLPRDARSTR